MRLLKVLLAAFAALFCLMYAAQNLVNLGPANDFIGFIVGMQGHEVYPNHFGPAFTSPIVIGAMLWIIILLEILAGLVIGKGAIDLWNARNATAEEFNDSKRYALLGTGLAVFIWFGIFSAIGGAYFQMWQTGPGSSALENAFWYSAQHGLLFLMIGRTDR